MTLIIGLLVFGVLRGLGLESLEVHSKDHGT